MKKGEKIMGNIILSKLSDKSKNNYINELHSFYIPYRDKLYISKNFTFGLEIEFKIKNYNLLNCPVYFSEYDYINNFMDSIGYNFSWDVTPEIYDHLEIISPVLFDNLKDWKTLEDILDFLISKGAYYSGICGAHVHVGKQALNNSVQSLYNFLKLLSVYEEVIIKFTNGSNYIERKNLNTSAKRPSKVINSFLEKLDCNMNTVFPKELYNKTFALNLGADSLNKFLMPVCDILENDVSNTIELRYANGTLNKIIWQNIVNFYLKAINSCSLDNFDIELLNYRSKKQENIKYCDDMAFELCDLVFSNDFDKHCFLRQYYKDFNIPSNVNPLIESKPFWKK